MTKQILLSAKNIKRSLGGLQAIKNVSLDLCKGRIHAVIGTNGAGKSTLINIISGEIPPSEGSIELNGQDVTHWTQPKRARAGLGRSYQRTTIFPPLTVHENCRLAAQATHQNVLSWLPAKKCKYSVELADESLELVGMLGDRDLIAGELSHGRKRQLEIAMSLATKPSVLLLDEPLAGMGAEETEGLLCLLNDLRSSRAMMLVEHDMDAIFRIADEITVMVNGEVIAYGDPEAIRNNEEVQCVYLGEEGE